MPTSNQVEQRLIVLAPHGRDAEVIAGVLARRGMACEAVDSGAALTAALQRGAAAAIVTEEALLRADIAPLLEWLRAQPPWSDFPFVVLLGRRPADMPGAGTGPLTALGNLVLLERPLSAATLGSAAESALRARRRQYAAREVLADREAVSAQLASLNATLEARVAERTLALAQANDRLTQETIERERAQQAMVQYQKMESLGRLTGGVAHDFNNLLHVVQGTMELILMMSKDEAIRARARIAKAACERGTKLTAQLLAFARNQALDLTPLRVDALFEAVLGMARPLLGKSIELQARVGPDVDCVVGDASQMEMALLNLAINARDAMPGGGRIVFDASRAAAPAELAAASDFVRIAVTDNGSGMSPEVAARVFEPFFTTKGVGKGTGLGLSQVYGMAHQSGGTAQVTSQPGAGTTIAIWLPAAARQAAQEGLPELGSDALAGARVLLVEDDDFVRAGMADALMTLGCDVTQASSGTEGLSALEQARPDLMLTDYLMPGMTGAELARHARKRYPDLPVLVATGYADMAAIQAALGEGTVLKKPFQLAELANVVRRSLREVTNAPAAR
ncbi:response regulator [Pseudoduganella armeniaca]|uniref:histidine kinase n=1 Tax=Pseudoduganella armeniaca TaxID=2072590 RepID=A0A2R4CAJ3_9BURK|nr:response regulator [Pseudoduganella armeniaca]AVR96615.1 hybrid sensor histidine kinase/response regulator [Pseudoduganella armeniaca]